MQKRPDKLFAVVRSHPGFLLFLCWLIFIIFKLPHLSLPYYSDEAWSYIPAIHMMETNGLSMLPDALPPDVSRGHPLLFYFLGALWMRVFW